MQCPYELEIKFPTWMGLELWHSGLRVQSLSNFLQLQCQTCKKFSTIPRPTSGSQQISLFIVINLSHWWVGEL